MFFDAQSGLAEGGEDVGGYEKFGVQQDSTTIQ
jgi:hypothetical protein